MIQMFEKIGEINATLKQNEEKRGEIDSLREQMQQLDALLSTNPDMEKRIQNVIRKVLTKAQRQMSKDIASDMPNDPRHAAKAVRKLVYRQLLGGNINILNMRKKAGTPTSYEPPRKLRPGQRGGNRVLRGARTDTVMHYGPHDRQWILRFVNSGTSDRMAGTRGGRLSGNRGSIAARNFFSSAGERALAQAADNLAMLIDTELEAILKEISKPTTT